MAERSSSELLQKWTDDGGVVKSSDELRFRSNERRRGVPWTQEEHKLFLLGLQKLGKGDWRGISRNFVKTRTPTQVASHAQKYFIRMANGTRSCRRSSLFDGVEHQHHKSAVPVAQGNQPSEYPLLGEPSDCTGPKEIEATGVQISAKELVLSPRKSKNLEVVENVSPEVKSAYTGPEEVEATGFQVRPEELVLLPSKSKVLEVVENTSLEVKSAYTAPDEVKATCFQVCPKELVISPRKCEFLEAVENISREMISCCCVFCEEVMGIY